LEAFLQKYKLIGQFRINLDKNNLTFRTFQVSMKTFKNWAKVSKSQTAT